MGDFLLTDYIGMSFLFYRVLDQINCVSPHLWEFSQNLGIGIGRVYQVEVSERGGVEDRPSISRCSLPVCTPHYPLPSAPVHYLPRIYNDRKGTRPLGFLIL